MKRLRFTFACAPYDRVQPLMNGIVATEGMDLNFIALGVEEIFWRQLRHQEFDGCEMSFSSYTMARSRGDDRFIAIPVFTFEVLPPLQRVHQCAQGDSRSQRPPGKDRGPP